jgi:hypothetical protein
LIASIAAAAGRPAPATSARPSITVTRLGPLCPSGSNRPLPASSSAPARLASGASTRSTGRTSRADSTSSRPRSSGSGFSRRSSRSTTSERPSGPRPWPEPAPPSGGLVSVARASVKVGRGSSSRSIRPAMPTVCPVIASACRVSSSR